MHVNSVTALVSGAAGAVVLTALHETLRRTVPYAPRMDIVGMRALDRLSHVADATVPDERSLRRRALAGDLIANTLYYAAVPGHSRGDTWGRGVLLGLAAGIGALALSAPLGLGRPPHSERTTNKLMTVGLYLAGGVAAAAAAGAVQKDALERTISERGASRQPLK